jgi:putative spermidine/putrescine transport system permease protein
MYLSRTARIVLRLLAALGMAVLYAPLVVIAILSLNTSKGFTWPPTGLTFRWWTRAFAHGGFPTDPLFTSLKTATSAALVALLLGSALSFAVHRFRFFGRSTLSLLVVLPIALPGIVTGIALNAAFQQVGIDLGIRTLIVAHATFCIVIVYNNVIARLRRLSPNLTEASADLGADGWQTFRLVTFPLVRSALLAGAVLAFALSFDEIVVTTFTAGVKVQTLPQWIFNNMFRPNQVPTVNVVATFVVLLSIVPVWIVQKVSDGTSGLAGR